MDIYNEYCTKAHQFQTDDAGEAFFKAAEVAEIKLEDFNGAQTCYSTSADCYRKILSQSAYESYRKCVEVYLKQRGIQTAIHRSVECGYIIEKEFGDVVKCTEFYDWADDLRSRSFEEHVCTLTPEYMENFCKQVWDRISKYNVSCGNIFKIYSIIDKAEIILEYDGICRKCVFIWETFSRYIQSLNVYRRRHKSYNNNSQIMEFITHKHLELRLEVKEARTRYEKLAEKTKKDALEEKMGEKAHV
ncbi:hypothetical protein RF11_11700 [Thelohanellus kitauei]|uniref:Alpha-soluble NSF attachment protein n=1 Tax=Thelohanellus kitauei TaxID=669202 RepID=A0A0C2JTQ0_THEKT|nr:hypothetical protein RF11_11700 [Thelohanellus kitauei]